jgi:hypothetical protein
MSHPDSSLLAARVRVMQIITGAIILGAGLYLGIVLFVRAQENPRPAPDPPILTYISIFFSLMMIIAAWVVPAQLTRARLQALRTRATTDDAFYLAYQSQLIVRLAQLEGATFLCLTAYLQEGFSFTLGQVIVLIALMLSQFPTAGRVERWVQSTRTIDRDGAIHAAPRDVSRKETSDD